MGLLKFTPAAWNAVEALLGTLDAPTADRLDMTGLLRRLLADKMISIGTFGTDGQWGEIRQSPGRCAVRGYGTRRRASARGVGLETTNETRKPTTSGDGISQASEIDPRVVRHVDMLWQLLDVA